MRLSPRGGELSQPRGQGYKRGVVKVKEGLCGYRKQTQGFQGRSGAAGIRWETEIDIFTLLYIK